MATPVPREAAGLRRAANGGRYIVMPEAAISTYPAVSRHASAVFRRRR